MLAGKRAMVIAGLASVLALLALGPLAACSGTADTNRGGGPGASDGGPLVDGDGSPIAVHDADPDSELDADTSDHGAGEPAALAGITELINEVRASVDVAPMTWDPDLAAIAQAWAESCTNIDGNSQILDHNPDRSDGYPVYVGENIFASGGTATPEAAVNLWQSESQWYDYDTNTCSAPSGSSCGHYTQLVWAASIKVGCGISNCPDIAFPNSIVCNFAPGGNVGGSRPY